MKGTVIDLKNIESLGIGFGKGIEKQLITAAIDMRKLKKEVLSRGGFHGSIQPKGFELPLPSTQRFDAHTRNQASDRRLQAKPTFILSKVPQTLQFRFRDGGILFEQGQVVAEVC